MGLPTLGIEVPGVRRDQSALRMPLRVVRSRRDLLIPSCLGDLGRGGGDETHIELSGKLGDGLAVVIGHRGPGDRPKSEHGGVSGGATSTDIRNVPIRNCNTPVIKDEIALPMCAESELARGGPVCQTRDQIPCANPPSLNDP